MALTDLKIKAAQPQAKPYHLTDGHGLFLAIQPSGSKLWRWKYRNGSYIIGYRDDVTNRLEGFERCGAEVCAWNRSQQIDTVFSCCRFSALGIG